MTPRLRWIAAAGVAGIVVLVVAAFFFVGRGGCGSREDVIAHVGLVSSGFQEAAAQGRIKIDDLASGVKRMNEASTAYEKTGDHQAYCDALNALSDEFKLTE